MKSKKGIAVILSIVFCILSSFNCSVSALVQQSYITVKINNNWVKTNPVPYMKNNKIFMPLRFATEALGTEMNWLSVDKTIKMSDGYRVFELFPGSKDYFVNGEKYTMEAAAEISDNRLMVPLSFISENLYCTAKWDPSTHIVQINKENIKIPEQYILKNPYSDSDLLWLARIIHVEVKGLSLDTKIAVANVVLNRVRSSSFPNTIYDVIFQKGQFPPAYKSGFKTLVPSAECIKAAKMALEGTNNIGKCLYFCDVPFKSKNITLYKKMDGMYFYY